MTVRLFAMDVDGTLTDGTVLLSGGGEEMKAFHVRDGFGLVRLGRTGVVLAFISGRPSPVTERRAGELGVQYCSNGVRDKLGELRRIAGTVGCGAPETAYIGDDLTDIPCIRWAGIGGAVADAEQAVKQAADVVVTRRGGHGAVREMADYLYALAEQGGTGS
ncbi:MAG: HAD hydrolase family protein [Synergistales bacterium]|nr:HAD hydrolase family protein [Synergistales bacterium]